VLYGLVCVSGTFIMEYVGEVLDYRAFKCRTRRYARENYEHHYFMALSADEVIDAAKKGNVSRFINHCCDPNAETQKVCLLYLPALVTLEFLGGPLSPTRDASSSWTTSYNQTVSESQRSSSAYVNRSPANWNCPGCRCHPWLQTVRSDCAPWRWTRAQNWQA